MPEGLSSSAGVTTVPGNDKLSMAPSAASTSTSSSPSLKINTSNILTSVCDTLLSSQGATPTTPVADNTVNLVVVSTSSMTSSVTSLANPTPICSITYTTSAHQYKLSEIVNQEKNILFKQDNNSGLELEPPRGDVLTVRRRSRQFFTLIEEDEVDSDLRLAPVSSDSSETQQEVKVDPILNLGDSLRRLYLPKERAHYRHKKRNKAQKHSSNDFDEERENRQPTSVSMEPPLSAGYESDGGKMGLFDKVLLNPELRSYSGSNPCVNEIPDIDCNDMVMVGSRKSKSLPTTPRVSPKLLRKKSVMPENNTEVMGPGYSFLASVAGDVRLKKLKNEQIHGQEMQRISESNKKYGLKKAGGDTGFIKASDIGTVKASDTVSMMASDTAVATRDLSSVTVSVSGDHLPHELEHTNHVSDFSDYLGHKYTSDNPKPLMQSLFDWGTQKKVKVSNKETNMFSPTSF